MNVSNGGCPSEWTVSEFITSGSQFTAGKPHCSGRANRQWLNAMVESSHHGRSPPVKAVVDVGCKSGNDAMRWLVRYGPKGSWSSEDWKEAVEARNDEKREGCEPDLNFVTAPAKTGPTVVCVEPDEKRFTLLQTAGKALGYDNKNASEGSFVLKRAAMSDRIASGLGELGSGMGPNVPRQTVDRLVSSMKLPAVDVLTIDTGGVEPAILRGAHSVLSQVRYLEFEVRRNSKTSEWAQYPLKQTVQQLKDAGLECYWASKAGKLLQITDCWQDVFDLYNHPYHWASWANVACVRKGDEWETVLQKFRM